MQVIRVRGFYWVESIYEAEVCAWYIWKLDHFVTFAYWSIAQAKMLKDIQDDSANWCYVGIGMNAHYLGKSDFLIDTKKILVKNEVAHFLKKKPEHPQLNGVVNSRPSLPLSLYYLSDLERYPHPSLACKSRALLMHYCTKPGWKTAGVIMQQTFFPRKKKKALARWQDRGHQVCAKDPSSHAETRRRGRRAMHSGTNYARRQRSSLKPPAMRAKDLQLFLSLDCTHGAGE